MRTLFVSPQIPWPLDVGSKIRIFNILRSYAETGPVTLVCLSQGENPQEAERRLAGIVRTLHCVSGPDGTLRAAAGRMGAVKQALRTSPRIVDEFRCAALAARLEQLLAEEQFDILHVQRLFMSADLPAGLVRDARARGLLAVIDVDDLESLKTRRIAASEPWSSPRRYLYWREYLKLRNYERRILKLFDLVLVCSARDRRLIESHPASPAVHVFANGAELEEGAGAGLDDTRTLMFLGAMNYQPNEDAVLYFHRAIFPLIQKEIPAARFVIAGKSPSAAVRDLHDGRDTVVQGYVEDKAALWSSCTVFVVPIRLGGGTRIKILEAMAARKPVVSTAVGAEGIDVTDGLNIMIGDSPEVFASGCVELLNSEPRRDAIAEAGHKLVARSYRWQAIRSAFVARLKTLGGRTRAADPQPMGIHDSGV